MKTKTYTIGEYSYPPILKLTKKVFQGDTLLTIKGYEYNKTQVNQITFNAYDFDRIQAFLFTCTTPYYTDNIMKWVKE